MNSKIIYLLIFIFISGKIPAQIFSTGLNKGGCQLYKRNLYAYGLIQSKSQTALCVYKLDVQLHKQDSVVIEHLKTSADNFLMLYSDTLHDYLNIYLQKKDRNAVTIFRFNSNLKTVTTAEDVDVARLNSSDVFGAEPFYFKNSVYSIKTHSDTSGKQFYVNKFELKPGTGNFEYEQQWQFPFERKFIHSAKVFYANKTTVCLFVTVNGGNKHGQWLLKLNAESGKLIRGIKLNDKTENSHYFFGNYSVDAPNKSMQLIGQKYSQSQFDLKANKINIVNLPAIAMYYLNIDSLDEIDFRQDFKIPVLEQKSGAKKLNSCYQLRITKLQPKRNGKVIFEADVYKSDGHPFCYYYTNSGAYSLNEVDEKLVLEKSSVSPNTQVESYFMNNDKLDLNGKLCVDSVSGFEKIFYRPLTLPVKLAYKTDELNNPFWVLSKSNLKKNSINYSFLMPVKKLYEIKIIDEFQKTANPVFTALGSKSFIISYLGQEGFLNLKLFNW
ncbi:MAG: hypothetical protein IT236_10795 [Bacteroidia bacterium]|nr:hypothetical protein [Bacteroidia bacterium]